MTAQSVAHYPSVVKAEPSEYLPRMEQTCTKDETLGFYAFADRRDGKTKSPLVRFLADQFFVLLDTARKYELLVPFVEELNARCVPMTSFEGDNDVR